MSHNALKIKILHENARHEHRVVKLLNELSRHDHAALNRRPALGGWTALQTAHHLLLAEEGSLRYVHKKLSHPAEFKRVGLGAHWRAFLLQMTLWLPIKFKSPPGVNPENLPEISTLGEVLERWRSVNASWNEFFQQLPPELADKTVYRHPRAGRLGWLQTIGFFRWHLARHRKQIRRALR